MNYTLFITTLHILATAAMFLFFCFGIFVLWRINKVLKAIDSLSDINAWVQTFRKLPRLFRKKPKP